LKYETASFTKR